MSICIEPKNTLRWINAKVLSILAGTLVVGLASPAYAQVCPTQAGKLLASDGAASDRFGWSIDISGDTAVIGMPMDDDNGNNSGSAYIFTRDDSGVWTQQAKLLYDGDEIDEFGWSVAISGDTVVVGARRDAFWSGSVYVFTRTAGVWTQQAELLASDGANSDRFGYSVSIADDTVVVGAVGDEDNGADSGSAYIFARTGGVWTQQAKLVAEDGVAFDNFANSVSIDGDTVIIGVHGDDDNGGRSGSAHIFTRDGGVWTSQAKIVPLDGTALDEFGYSVSINGDTAIIGAPIDDNDGNNSGSAYIFTRTGGVWTQQSKLIPADGSAVDYFGNAVAISNGAAAVGANRNDDNGSSSGSAYAFTSTDGVWTEQAKFLATDGTEFDQFGYSVAISGDTVAIGSPFADESGSWSGSAYIFDLECAPCLADLTGDGVVDISDAIAFLDIYTSGVAAADLTDDGILDISDVIVFLESYNTGCP